MAFILENIRLKELVIIAQANKPFFDDLVSHLSGVGYPSLHAFVNEDDDSKAERVILNYLVAPVPQGVRLLDGVGAPYQVDKGKWLMLGWVFRDAPEQRLKPLLGEMPGNSLSERQSKLFNAIRQHVRFVFPDPEFWTWNAIMEVMVDRLEGSRRAKKGNLFELIVRRSLRFVFNEAGLTLTVAEGQLRIGSETYDVVVKGKKKTLLIPVKTRETMGGGHAHIFTRDIHKSIAEAIDASYPCLPVIIAESWTGNLGDLACDDYIYLQMNPNQVTQIEPVLLNEFRKRVPVFSQL